MQPEYLRTARALRMLGVVDQGAVISLIIATINSSDLSIWIIFTYTAH